MIHSAVIDRHRILQLNGKPTFPILARHIPEGGSPQLLRDVGFHAFRVTVFGNEGAPPEPVPEPMDGISFWAYLYDRGDFTRATTHESELRRTVSVLRKHPSLLAYENYNEPTLLYQRNSF